MIAKLKGLVDSVGENTAIIDVGGVGYLIFASAKTLRTFPGPGEPVEVLIETHVREDHIHLYGFVSEVELEMFRLLTSVQGVGTKLALAILSTLDPNALQAALISGDKAAMTSAPGVGPKLAARILNELKEKVGAFAGTPTLAPRAGVAGEEDFQDALSALVKLGYKPSQAHMALMAASQKVGDGADVSALVKGGLRELSR